MSIVTATINTFATTASSSIVSLLGGVQYYASGSVLDLDRWFGGADKTPFDQVVAPGTCASGIDALVIYAGGVINLLLVILVVIAIILMIITGFRYLGSGGDQGTVEESSKSIRNILVGLVFTFLFLIGLSLLFSAFGPDQTTLIC